jgi:hypothetical protein
MEMSTKIDCKADLSAMLIRADGTCKDLGIISKRDLTTWWKRLLDRFRRNSQGIVTTVGVNYMASDFASGGVTPTISGFKFHDSGTGTAAEAITDTTITPAGPARVTGTPSNPSANVYKTIATVAYTSTLAITEWGLFSAATSGTLWDRRKFSAINVVNGDSIQFTYSLTISAGGT